MRADENGTGILLFNFISVKIKKGNFPVRCTLKINHAEKIVLHPTDNKEQIICHNYMKLHYNLILLIYFLFKNTYNYNHLFFLI